MLLTVSQAARAAGKSKGQISRMVKDGKISADRSTPNRPMIDSAELLRVYPHADLGKRNATTKKETIEKPETGRGNSALQAQVDLLREERDRLLANLERERREHREERDQQRAERDRLLGIVEVTQRQIADLRPMAEGGEKRGLFRRLFG